MFADVDGAVSDCVHTNLTTAQLQNPVGSLGPGRALLPRLVVFQMFETPRKRGRGGEGFRMAGPASSLTVGRPLWDA